MKEHMLIKGFHCYRDGIASGTLVIDASGNGQNGEDGKEPQHGSCHLWSLLNVLEFSLCTGTAIVELSFLFWGAKPRSGFGPFLCNHQQPLLIIRGLINCAFTYCYNEIKYYNNIIFQDKNKLMHYTISHRTVSSILTYT